MVTFELFEDTDGKWRWNAKARNGRKVAASGESFASRRNAERSMLSLLDHVRVGEFVALA